MIQQTASHPARPPRPSQPPFPTEDNIYTVADWVELTVLSAGTDLSKGKLETVCSRSDIVGKTAAQDAWAEISRRGDVTGTAWPFEIVDDVILRPRPNGQFPHLYWFLAALSMRVGIENQARILFERCVAEILEGLTRIPGIRIGFPRLSPVPSDLTEAVKFYSESSYEAEGFGKSFLATDRDLGIDVVSWFPFRDKRGAFVHMLGQCATGADWKEKLPELNPHKWTDHLNWAVPPVRFFATPIVLRKEEIRRLSMDGGLLLDRPRLLELAEMKPLGVGLRSELESYCSLLYSEAGAGI